jgi:hypothetical protein
LEVLELEGSIPGLESWEVLELEGSIPGLESPGKSVEVLESPGINFLNLRLHVPTLVILIPTCANISDFD